MASRMADISGAACAGDEALVDGVEAKAGPWNDFSGVMGSSLSGCADGTESGGDGGKSGTVDDTPAIRSSPSSARNGSPRGTSQEVLEVAMSYQ